MRHVFVATLVFVSAVAATAIVILPSGAQGSPLAIDPNGGTFPINTTAQFRALYNGTDVTSQATWSISGAFTNDPRRGDLLGPGQFRLLYGGEVYVQARYQGQTATAIITVQGTILGPGFKLVSSKRNLKKGETATISAQYSEGRTCPTSNCPPQFAGVTSQATWSTSNASVLQMVSPGVFRALTNNPTATITATYRGITQTVAILPVSEDDTVAPGVTLVREIYNIGDIPFLWYSQTTPFHNAEYLSGGYFVVAGTCSPAVNGNIEKINAQGALNNIDLQGGLYAFRSDGTFVGKRNVCHDGDIPGAGNPGNLPLYCNEGGACEIPVGLSVVSSNQILREMNDQLDASHGFNSRPPLQYEITPTKINLVGKPYTGNLRWDWEEGDKGNFQIGNNVVVGGKIIGVKNKFEGSSFVTGCGTAVGTVRPRHRYSNVIQTAGSFGVVREWSNPYVCPPPSTALSGVPPVTLPEVVPIAGVGDYLIARQAQDLSGNPSASAARAVRVYRLRGDNTLEEVQQLPGLQQEYGPYTKDSANPNRIAFNVGGKTVVYEAGSNGLTLVRSMDTGRIEGAKNIPNLALMGDYIAYAACNLPPIASTPGVADAYVSCGVRVWKGTAEIASFHLPVTTGPGVTEGVSFADRASAIEIAPNGNMIVGTIWGHLYMYKLRAVTTSSTGGTTTATTTQRSAALRERYGAGERSAISSYLDRLTALLERLGLSFPLQEE